MTQQKILIVSPCQGAYGGIEAFVLAVAASVRREPDLDVRVCFKKTKDFVLHPTLETMLRGQAATFCERAGGELIAAIQWADLVHLQNASPDVIAISKLLRKRLVLTIHNYIRPEINVHRVLWRMGAKLADARWFNSEFVWETWEGTRRRRGSSKVPTVSDLPEGWTPPEQRHGFAFIGRWIANKGVDTLIEAYAAAKLDRKKWPLVLMGDGPLRETIERKIAADGIGGVSVRGFVDEATKTEVMKNARWMVVPPNTREDFGLTAVEARNVGVPCIITRDGGLPEAAGKQALVCEPGNAMALAKSLEEAAAMDETEYAIRAQRTREELRAELEPMEFYARAYRQILRGEGVD